MSSRDAATHAGRERRPRDFGLGRRLGIWFLLALAAIGVWIVRTQSAAAVASSGAGSTAGESAEVATTPQQHGASGEPAAPLRVRSEHAWGLLVTDLEGRPIEGAALRDVAGGVLATTDRLGAIDLVGAVAQGLSLRRDGFLDCAVGPIAGGQRHEVRMARAASLRLTAIDANGAPVEGVLVEVVQQDGADAKKHVGTTDAAGQVAFASLAAGPFRLRADAAHVLVSRYDVPAVVPAQGTIHVARPIVAFGECVVPPDSWRSVLSSAISHAGLAPQGPEQSSVAVFADRLRAGRSDRVAFALCCPLASIPAGAGLEVSFLAGGVWQTATIPFRSFEPGMQPIAFGEQRPVAGQVVALEVRMPSGVAMPVDGVDLRIEPQQPAPRAHEVLVRALPFQVRLPRGRYKLTSRCGAVAFALPNTVLEVVDRPANEPALPWSIQLARDLAIVDFEVPWPDGAAPLDVGNVLARHEAGGADVRYFLEGGLCRAGLVMSKGWSDVVLTDRNGVSRSLRVHVPGGGRFVVDGLGRAHAK